MLNLKNTREREMFIDNYENWGIWKSVPEIGLTFYRYDFANGAKLIVTEYQEYRAVYDNSYYISSEKEFVTRHKYCLILPEGDSPNHCRTYTLAGTGRIAVVDYMTKYRLCL